MPFFDNHLPLMTTGLLSSMLIIPTVSTMPEPSWNLVQLSSDENQPLNWRFIFNDSPEPPVDGTNGGTRPLFGSSDLCFIAPLSSSGTAEVWSDRPTLTWQSPANTVSRLVLVPRNDDYPTLTYTISEDEHRITTPEESSLPLYQLTVDEPLSPETTYHWQFYVTQNDIEQPFSRFVPLQVLDQQERDRLLAIWPPTDSDLEQAQRFADAELWGDLWQFALSIPNPPDDLTEAIANSVEQLCAPTTSAEE